MHFRDVFIEKEVNSTEVRDLVLLIGLLRGDIWTDNETLELDPYVQRHKSTLALLEQFLSRNARIRFEQFNEILLILDKNRVSEGFFRFFFNGETTESMDSPEGAELSVDFTQFREGVVNFRGYALLKYGNFRYAHKAWREKSLKEIQKDLRAFTPSSGKSEEAYKNRGPKAIDIARLEKSQTPLLGYLTGADIKEDHKLCYAIENRFDQLEFQSDAVQQQLIKAGINKEEVLSLSEKLRDDVIAGWKPVLGDTIKKLQTLVSDRPRILERGIANTDVYLTWDYMDVYVATSMRNDWEYEAAYDLIEQVFQKSELAEWNLRFFDPTQSFIQERLNKGLVESLMLKRAKVTIYLVQEIDSLGKDSELAATLAQGKTVIAFVPKFSGAEIDQLARTIESRPLAYFYRRYLANTFDSIQTLDRAQQLIQKTFGEEAVKIEKLFRSEVAEFFDHPRFKALPVGEEAFKKRDPANFGKMCKYLAILEACAYDKRAGTLVKSHPLAMQVDLHTGVANGILVVRDYASCVSLVKKVLSNDLDFEIQVNKPDTGQPPNSLSEAMSFTYTELRERISQCPHRVVTAHEKITNSFWAFYRTREAENA